MTKRQKRIAIVVQRYGEEVNGGAELHARWLAERLRPLGDIHAITTCAVDYTTWENSYPAGSRELNGVYVHRFPVDAPRQWKASQKQTKTLLLQDHDLFAELQWVKDQGPYSSPLLQFIEESYDYFDVFIFFTYLYATTRFGLPLVSDKAILVPTAHDEPFLYLPVYRPLFHLPGAIVYNTLPEKLLVNRVTRNGSRTEDMIAGIGINVPDDVSAARFRQKFTVEGDFVLYIGRIDHGKNVPALLDDFLRFRRSYGKPLKLLLGGKAHIDLPDHPDIVHLGFLSEEDKFDGLAATAVLLMPSLYESLSMIVLEAWLTGTPVLVNGRCEVLKQQCRYSNGGLYYTSYDEFQTGLTNLLASSALRDRLGQQGKQFTDKQYRWEIIIEKYRQLLEKFPLS